MHCFRAAMAAAPLLFGASHAFAHAHLKAAQPPVDGVVTAAPAEVVIDFTEGVVPQFCAIEVQNAQGQTVSQGQPHTAPGNDKRLITAVGALPPGTYKVTWHATATDTHKTEGSYQFTVRP